MSTRKQIILTVTELEQKFQQHQIKAHQQTRYLQQHIKDNKIIIISVLLTAFIIGFKGGRLNTTLTWLRQLGQVAVVATIASIKNGLWSALIDRSTLTVLRYFLHNNQTKSA
ncbi:hypothetical protein [Legionella nagasakiensis]|uniref:hypothetical protein n=1 Tax=Legionella nagasakiensis TaxID=535290 RepID=UPI00105455DA|nr:hypothetical protein [Legionella nagasakiensis]